MKPREYKGIPVKEKEEIKTKYEFEKTRKELYEEEIRNLEKMVPLEYLEILNSETKEKLIGLCLERKILDTEGEEVETMYEEDELEEEDEDMDIEENFE